MKSLLIQLAILLLMTTSCQSLLQSCPDSYFFDAQHCETCTVNCKCVQENTCDSCIDGYTMFDGTCMQCPQAVGIYGQCSECCSSTNGTVLVCTDCSLVANKFSFLFSGRCILSDGCFEVDLNGFCQECRTGFYKFNNLCYGCAPACATCSDSDHCLKCADGYFWQVTNGGLCTICPNGCATCQSNGTCNSCLASFYQYADHCLGCPANCNACIDGSTCTGCSAGILVSNLCVQCHDTTYGGTTGCLKCIERNNFIECVQCDDLYFLDTTDGVCRRCSDSLAGAERCRDANTPTQCQNDHDSTLTNRFYLIGISCVQNIKNCKYISSIDGNCSNCYDSYTLTAGACVQCPFSGCDLANSTVVANACVCTACLSGFYLTATTCTVCPTADCSVCPSSTCSECKPLFYLNLGACSPSTAANCKVCSSSLLCSVCNDGYYKGSDDNCYECQTNCMICSDRSTCTMCSNGFLLKQAKCVGKPSNCISIDVNSWNPLKCINCDHGFYLFEGHCLECSVELGTLKKCVGLCPIDYYIQNLLSQNWNQNLWITFGVVMVAFLSILI